MTKLELIKLLEPYPDHYEVLRSDCEWIAIKITTVEDSKNLDLPIVLDDWYEIPSEFIYIN